MSGRKFIGSSIREQHSGSLIRGAGMYVDDISLPGMLYAGFVRSKYGHAKFRGPVGKIPKEVIDMIGSHEVLDICSPVESIEPIFHPNLKAKRVPWYALPTEKVRYPGEPVLAIAVERQYHLEDALDQIEFEFEPLPTVNDALQGLRKDAPLLYDDWGDNVMLTFHLDSGDVDSELARADLVIDATIKVHRHTAAPIENRTYLADYDKKRSFLTLWTTTQAPHVTRTYLSSILNLPENSIRVVQPDVGGAFGRGHPTYPEEVLVCLLSMKMGRPVKWVGTRTDCLMTDHHSREQIHKVKAALKKNGTITAIDDSITVDMGVFQPTGGIASTLVTAKMVPGPYDLKDYRVKLTGVSTNKSPFGANRGFGKESAALVHERIMDYASEKLNIDPAEIRLRNFIRKSDFPYVNASGEKYDSGDYHTTFSKLLTLIEYEDFRKKQRNLRKKNKYIGLGLAFVLCPSSLSNRDNLYTGWDSATVTMDPSGYITVLTGLSSPGTGHEVAYSQVVADELGVEPSSIRIVEGDTLACPYGSGNWTDRGATIGASAVLLAARKLGVKLRRIGGALLDLPDQSLGLGNGFVYSLDAPSRRVSFSEIAWTAHASPHKLPPEVEPGLMETATFTLRPSEIDRTGKWGLYQIVSSAATAAIVEVDPETFQTKILRYVMIDDSGVIINPAVVHGQLVGAAAQGISSSFFEELIYKDGQLLTSTLMDYKLATAIEVPNIEVDQIETPSPYTLMGTKGAGEGGIVAPYAALCSAVEDAIRPLGVRIAETPLNSEKLWRESFSR